MVLSPASGVLFEITLASVYGTSPVVDAFRVAYLLIGLASQLFVGIVLPNALIPALARLRADGREDESWAITVCFVGVVGLLSLPLVLTALIAPGEVIDFLGPGLDRAARAEGVTMVRFFALIFCSMLLLGAINCVLNVYRKFGLPQIYQIVINLASITTVALIGRQFGGYALSIGMLAGALIGLLIGLAGLRSVLARRPPGLQAALTRRGLAAEYRKMAGVVVPLLAIVVAGQWQIVIINRVLSDLPSGTLATFGYAFKMTAMIGVLPMAIATVVFPSISALWGGEDRVEARRLSTRAASLTLLLIIPIVVILSFTANEAVGVLLQHGKLTDADVVAIGATFSILIWSALSGALNTLMMKVSYAVQDGLGPLVQTLVLALAATVLVAPFAALGGIRGVAAYTALSQTIIVLAYFAYLQFRFHAFDGRYLAGSVGRILLSAALAALAVAVFLFVFGDAFANTFLGRLAKIVAVSCIYLPVFALAAQLLRVAEIAELAGFARRRVKPLFARLR